MEAAPFRTTAIPSQTIQFENGPEVTMKVPVHPMSAVRLQKART